MRTTFDVELAGPVSMSFYFPFSLGKVDSRTECQWTSQQLTKQHIGIGTFALGTKMCTFFSVANLIEESAIVARQNRKCLHSHKINSSINYT